MHLYGLKNCDTCRKALKALPEVGFVDVRVQGVPAEVLDAALATFGEELVNTRSTTWRSLDEATRQLPRSELLSSHPTLMKRPLIVEGDRMTIGWTRQVQQEHGVG